MKPQARGLRHSLHLVLVILSLLALLPGIAALPAMDRDEARFAQASRQMAVSGDWIDIRFQDAPRYKKPAGIYWLQAAAVKITGQGAASQIWVHRLPSLIAAVLACVALAWAGAPLIGHRAGVLAGAMLSGLLLLQVEARLATTDATLLLTSVLAMGALFRARLGQGSPAIAAIFWTALAAGVLVKGPMILLPILGLLLWCWITEGRPRWFAGLYPLRGMIWAALLVLPWFLAILSLSKGAFLDASLGQDLGDKLASGQEGHGMPPGSYMLAFWLSFWPWTLLAPAAGLWLWRQRRSVAARLILGWCLPAWVLLEIVPTKLLHYPLPLYPALILAVAAVAHELLEGRQGFRGWLPALGSAVFAIILILLAVLLILGPLRYGAGLAPGAVIGVALAVGAGGLGLVWLWRDRMGSGLAAIWLSGVVMLGTASSLAFPAMTGLWVSDNLARETRLNHCISGPVALVGYHEPSAVFRLGGDTVLTDAATAKTMLESGAVAAAWIPEDAEILPPEAAAARIEGFNYSSGKSVRLRLFLPPNASAAPHPCKEQPS